MVPVPMSNYTDESLVKLHDIKEVITSIHKFGFEYSDFQQYVDSGVPLSESFVQKQIDNLIGKHGKGLVSEFLIQTIKVERKGQVATFEATSHTLFKGKRTERVCEDDNPETAWGHYRKFLEDSGFTNIDDIKASALNVLEMMNQHTDPDHPVRGAVIGNVQSGKTANMEALLSLAADNGWNFFVILTGLTTNLMDQTRDRMLGDLQRDKENPQDPLIYSWKKIDPLDKAKDFLTNYDIRFDSHELYIYHAQKNVAHLRNVIQCLDKIPQKDKVHLLVIDDESDQASVDSSKKEALNRSAINQYIINLVYNRKADSKEGNIKKCKNNFGSVNYVGYTATPYANLLNEPHGLYPEHFITGLTPPSQYFGLKQFYGDGVEEGLNKHVMIIDDSIGKIIKRRSNKPVVLPETLKDSIAWFYCCVGIQKLRKYGKPVSMLINVDVYVNQQIKVNTAVREYILNEKEDLEKRCKDVYLVETARLTHDQFLELLPDYGEDVEGLVINDYPEYSEIEPYVLSLIRNGLTHIAIDKNKNYVYSTDTIHDCVDNGSGKSIPLEETGKGYTSRIIYPNKKDNADVLKETPAFLVMGGQTLSRGLTIEGLVSTYFIRKTATADTCLQMARWFGFRRGYEMLPRVWMDTPTYDAFCNLAIINQALFREIEKYNMEGLDPKEYHAKIRDVPASCMLKSLTSANKSKASSKTYKNGGFRATDKYPTKFYNSVESLEKNFRLTEKLIEGYDGERSPTGSSMIFKGIPFDKVVKYLTDLDRPQEKATINSFDPFLDWLNRYDPETVDDCNVVIYGTESESSDLVDPVCMFAGKYRINKVQRSRKTESPGEEINFKTVRDKKSLLMDLDLDKCKELLESEPGAFEKLIKGDPVVRCQVRRSLNMSKTATLSITIIGVDRKPENGYVYDIIAPSIFIPGDIKSEYDFEKTPYVCMVEYSDDSSTHS